MAQTAYLTSALVTGVLLLAVWMLVLRMENWRQYEPAGAEERRYDRSSGDGDSVGAWIAGFLALTLVAGGGAVLLVSDASLAAAAGSWVALVALFGVLLGAYLLWGTYSSARFRGLPSAHAALVSAWLFGILSVAVIAIKLVVSG
jgi:hypothetical protein